MRRFATTDPDFDARFDAFLAERRGMPADVDEAVAAVLEAVLSEGLEAVLRYTERFDRVRLTEDKLQVTPREIQAGVDACPDDVFERTASGVPTIARLDDCQTCFLCELYCPADALYVSPFKDRCEHVDEADLICLKTAIHLALKRTSNEDTCKIVNAD